MLLTGHQPNYLPYPGFFQKIAASDAFLIVDTTQFVKRGPFGWIHRNRIGTHAGPQWLSLPVLHRGRFHQRIADTELNPRLPWRRKHWRTIELGYQHTPGWTQHGPSLAEIYRQEWTHLAPFTTALIRWFLQALQIEVPVHLSSTLQAEGRSTEYIVAFCRELGATAYLSGVHGRDYLDHAVCAAAGLELRFQQYTPPRYHGHGGTPVTENLSLLDFLFWEPEQARSWVHTVPEVQHT